MNMNRNKFSDEEIPYQTLQKFGLTQEMIGDLPIGVLESISKGYRSPVLPIEISDEEGNTYKSRTRYRLFRTEDQRVDVMFFPQLAQADLDRFSPENRNRLQAEKAVVESITPADGSTLQAFIQIDKGTNQILYVPTPVIGRNIQILSEELHLNAAELNCLRNGDPLTVMVKDDVITLGVDLNEETGIRLCDGDTQKWKAQEKKDWDKYNFGCFGCWSMDEQGNLDYIPEEEYTDEMWDEMKKKGDERKAKAVTPKM